MFNQSSPLLTKQGLEVSANGEQVILRVGNVEIPMHFEQALDLSKWIRFEAALAKRGRNRAKTVRSLGILRNLEAPLDKALPDARGGLFGIHVKAKAKSWHREDVVLEGRSLVAIKIGSKTLRLHFEKALTISQWLRVRAKEAQRTAGDTRHWSEVKSQ